MGVNENRNCSTQLQIPLTNSASMILNLQYPHSSHFYLLLFHFLKFPINSIYFSQRKFISRTIITGRGSPNGKLSDALTAKYTIGKSLSSLLLYILYDKITYHILGSHINYKIIFSTLFLYLQSITSTTH